MSTIQDHFDTLTSDHDISFEEFQQYLKEFEARFFKFYRAGIETDPGDFEVAKSIGDWFEELQAFQDTLDGEKELDEEEEEANATAGDDG